MRVVIQRVSKSSVEIGGNVKSSIEKGLLVLAGIETMDESEDIQWMAGKIAGLRIFNDENGVMNRSVTEIDGEILVISQFTLHAMTKKGNRPSYIRAAKHEKAIPLYEQFCNELEILTGKIVKTGTFAADMQVSLINDGPVTITIDSKIKE